MNVITKVFVVEMMTISIYDSGNIKLSTGKLLQCEAKKNLMKKI